MSAIRLHPERTSDPDVLRWSTGPTTLPPRSLDALVDEGVLVGVDITAGQACTRLAPGRSWQEAGARVWSALFRALQAAEQHRLASDDEALRRAVAAHLGQRVAPLAASHGGRIRIVDVADAVLTVEFGGACFGCPAADATLENVIEAETTSRFPAIREVRAVPPADRSAGALGRLRRVARFGRARAGSRFADCSGDTSRRG